MLRWIETTGGPLICGEQPFACGWLGIEGNSDPDDGSGTDYDRACEARDYVEVMTCNGGRVLILDDEPLASTFITTKRGELAVARWASAKSEDVAEAVLAEFVEGSRLEEPKRLEVGGDTLWLFDSPLRGDKAERLEAHVAPGVYWVTTEALEEDGVYSFVLHRFTR
jgi:Immunity protein 21